MGQRVVILLMIVAGIFTIFGNFFLLNAVRGHYTAHLQQVACVTRVYFGSFCQAISGDFLFCAVSIAVMLSILCESGSRGKEEPCLFYHTH